MEARLDDPTGNSEAQAPALEQNDQNAPVELVQVKWLAALLQPRNLGSSIWAFGTIPDE